MARPKLKAQKSLEVSDVIPKIFTNLNNPAVYSNVRNVYKEAKKLNKNIQRKDVTKELESSRTYTLHKPRRVKFPRLVTIPSTWMSDVQGDLADFQRVASYNDGFRYLLVCVDVLSRRIFCAPVKSKSSKDMIQAFDIVFEKMPIIPQHLFTDKGIEFEAKEMKRYFEKKEVQKYVAQSPEVKAAFAERAIRTVKTRLYKYFTDKETYRWIDVYDKIVEAINKSVNRITGMRPIDVNNENKEELWNKLYLDEYSTSKRYQYNEGDYVRIGKKKGDFEKGYVPNYTQDVFKIDQVKQGAVPNYRLVDNRGEEIVGKFYEHEFSKTKHEPNEYFIVEKVLDERVRAGKPEFLVKWRGLPVKDATWVRRDNI